MSLLRIAENECPWGEMADNYRAAYVAAAVQVAMTGDKAAWGRMQRIAAKLFDR